MVHELRDSQLRIFLSYAHQDRELVETLHDKLTIAHHEVWFDEELRGGQQWWDAILNAIAESDLVIFVASPDSFHSKACGLELAWASSTNRQIMPIEVRPVDVLDGPDVIISQQIHVEPFVNPTDDDWIRLMADIAMATRSGDLPDPMPEPPPAPVVDLTAARQIVGQTSISGDEQRSLVAELKVRLPNADETAAVVAVLEQLRSYPDIVESVGDEIDDLLRQYRTSKPDEHSSHLLDTVVKAMKAHECTPILGTGMTEWLFGTRKDHAQAWAKSFGFPLEAHRHSDLPQVAQFVAVEKKPRQLRAELAAFYRERLRDRFPDAVDDPDGALNDMVLAVWRQASERFATEPHTVLAQMPCEVYVTTEVTSLLTEALREEGKDPVVDFCRWNPAVDPEDWPESPLTRDRDYVLTIERPLVFHVLGTIEYPDSIVITEDEYFDFLAEVARNRDLIPGPVREHLADSTLLFLGFGLDDWDVRVLMRSLISPQSARQLGQFQHVAAQVSVESAGSLEDARRYIETYFQRFREPSIDVYWSSVEEFSRHLAMAWEESS